MAICKLILNEFEETTRKINAAPSIKKMKDDAIPDIIKEEFPDSEGITEKTSNGMI